MYRLIEYHLQLSKLFHVSLYLFILDYCEMFLNSQSWHLLHLLIIYTRFLSAPYSFSDFPQQLAETT